MPLGAIALFIALTVPYLGYLLALDGPMNIGVIQAPSFLVASGGLLGMGIWIAMKDIWLGALVVWIVLWAIITPSTYTFELAFLFSMAVLGLVFMRRFSPAQAKVARGLLVGAAIIQVLIANSQWAGHKWIYPFGSGAIGMIGNPDYLGAYLAIIAPIAPLWLLPFFFFGLFVTLSISGLVAMVAGLCWVHRKYWRFYFYPGAFVLGLIIMLKPNWSQNVRMRLDVWWMALDSMDEIEWLVGRGLGRWANAIPPMQDAKHVWDLPDSGRFTEAHNEYVQVFYELGAVGLACVTGWLWNQRKAFLSPYGGSLVAIAVCALGMFGFHIVSVAVISATLIGLATMEEPNALAAL